MTEIGACFNQYVYVLLAGIFFDCFLLYQMWRGSWFASCAPFPDAYSLQKVREDGVFDSSSRTLSYFSSSPGIIVERKKSARAMYRGFFI